MSLACAPWGHSGYFPKGGSSIRHRAHVKQDTKLRKEQAGCLKGETTFLH